MTDVTTTDTTASGAEQDGGVVGEQLVTQLAELARAEGMDLDGEDGLLQRLTKIVVESALEGELDDHLGYGKHDPAGRNGENFPNLPVHTEVRRAL